MDDKKNPFYNKEWLFDTELLRLGEKREVPEETAAAAVIDAVAVVLLTLGVTHCLMWVLRTVLEWVLRG